MNTADRSIDALDSALRRRFSFIEIVPDPALLTRENFAPTFLSIDLSKLLESINCRVEYLLDRDHKIGHSYFMNIKAKSYEVELANLQTVFKDQIIPLLEDYFYGNLEKVCMVIGENFIARHEMRSDCLLSGKDKPEFQEKYSWKVADIRALTEEDFKALI